MSALRPARLALFLKLVLIVCVSTATAQHLTATYAHGGLSVTIPYHGLMEGSGRLTAEIVDPEDHVLGRSKRHLAVANGDGAWQELITPETTISFDEIVWQRVRYRFEYDEHKAAAIAGVEAVSEILQRPVVRILGQSEYLAGSGAAVRVIVTDGNNNISETGSVRVELLVPDHEAKPLFSGRLNHRGTVEAKFKLPAGLTGKVGLHYIAETPIGTTEYTESIEIAEKASILLTTEKPIYQPGQTIHVRALALDRADHKAVGDRPLTFEVEDSRGNKVFKKVTRTDSFGVASADFSLADEVNLGTYHLRARMGDAGANTAEITLNVERYVLPKFKVDVVFTNHDGKPKKDYRPGDHVTGTVRANYFFGKPVDHAEITIKASSMDVAVFEAASATGMTDGDGAYHFDLKLPEYFAGKPLSQGAARALVEATVKDSAAHSETRGEPFTISESCLLLTAVPEGGSLIPHLENQVYLLSSYPDGTLASATIVAHIRNMHDQTVTTDASGVAVIRMNPGDGLDSFHVDADDNHGNRASTTIPLETRDGTDPVLLRASRAVLKIGDPIHLTVLSTRASGAAYVDIVKNGQTIVTRDLALQHGQAELTLIATPEMAGTLDMDAYVFGRDAQVVADHRLAFVQPADELKIETKTDAAEYKPGADARVRFHVTNVHGEGVSAALGVQVVDEAVFALAEKQPGFAKVFFYLEQEVMKPRYEIHSLSMPRVLQIEGLKSEGAAQDVDASALFAATEMASPVKLDTEFGRTLPQDKYAEYRQRYEAALLPQIKRIAATLPDSDWRSSAMQDLTYTFAHVTLSDGTHPRDAWGTPFHVEPAAWGPWRTLRAEQYYLVRSAGPDRKFNTSDDLTVSIAVSNAGVTPRQGSSNAGSFNLNVEHDRGPFNGRAEFTGTITDQTGAVIPTATITLRRGGDTRTAHADASGQFNFAALPAGRYRVEISAQGFAALAGEVDVRARDRAVLAALLAVGSTNETVTVSADAVERPRVMFGAGFGVGSPVAAGVMKMGIMDRAAETMVVNAQATMPLALEGREVNELVKMKSPAGKKDSDAHVRSYFPEALYINPEIITDGKGDASITIPIADSITTWHMAMLASTRAGALGTGASSLKVFQDFFVDLDLPVTLTQGDRVTIPIGVYNYSGKGGNVSLKLEADAWYSLENDSADKNLMVESGRVGSSQFTLNANRIGKFKLTLRAHMDGVQGRDDIIVREIEVVPNGREQDLVFNGRLDTSATENLKFPSDSIPDATSVLVRLYPGPLSQVIEGMDSILQMPGGCFEQTSSSTYPNVLALDYMKRTKKLTPEVHAKAEGYIANGYQRLLTFEVPGGGFSWFGRAPANKILTAYGLMEFSDMAKVSDVDPRLIDRTRDWLIGQQQPDGSWKPDASFINEGATNRYNSNVLRITAYIAWSLANTGYEGPAVKKAKQYVEANMSARPDTYTLAVIANFAADYRSHDGTDREFTRRAMQALLDTKTEKDDTIFWAAEETGVYSTGASAAIETTGLAVQALLKWGQASETARKALAFIASKKQAAGNWGTTQATIMSLRALLMASESNASDVRGTLHVMLNGKAAETLQLNPENNDLLHQFVLKGIDAQTASSVQLQFEGSGGLAYQIVGRYFTPWEEKHAQEALSIDVAYDRTKLAQNDIATATATVRNNLDKTANMVMVDLGIPPGFDLLSEDLQAFAEKTAGEHAGRLEKFSLTATQAILYFNALAPGQTMSIHFRLRAKYPIKARSFESRVYEYYAPDISTIAKPGSLEIVAK